MARFHTSNRVFHVINSFGLGGSEKVALNIASSRHNQFEYHLIEVFKGDGPYATLFSQELERRGIPYHRSSIRWKKIAILLFPFRFFFICVKYRPAIIHSHAEKPDISVFLFHKLFGWLFRKTRYVRTIHNTVHWKDWEKIGKIVEPFFIQHHSNISISQAVSDSYRELYGNPGPIIYNGIEEEKQIPFDKLDKNKTNVLFAGRLEDQKGIDVLIQVIKECQHLKDIYFWVVGEGRCQKIIMDSIDGLDNVTLRDTVFGLSSYLASFDYLFMPSIFEGLGLLSVEASYAKVPTIINDCPGLNETLPEDWPMKVKKNGIEHYMQIFNNIEKYDRHALGLRAYHFVRQKFSIEEMQQAYESFYM